MTSIHVQAAALGYQDTPLKRQFQDQLPPTELEFYIPSSMMEDEVTLTVLIDTDAMSRLPTSLNSLVQNTDTPVFALRTTGDGNCLTSAISRSLWGSESWSAMLREALVNELIENETVYRSMIAAEMQADVEDSVWFDDFVKPAQTLKEFLGPLHCFALANVIKRPIILYAHDEITSRFGYGVHGSGGTFIPSLIAADEQVSHIPVAIAWSSDAMVHFVPLCGKEGEMRPVFPVIPCAFRDHEELLSTRLRSDTGEARLGVDVVNPFVNDLASIYKREKRADETLARYIASVQHAAQFDDALKRAAALERHRHAALPREPVVVDGVQYDGRLMVQIHKDNPDGEPLGVNVDDDPLALASKFFAKHREVSRRFFAAKLVRFIQSTQRQIRTNTDIVPWELTDIPGPSQDRLRYRFDGEVYDFILIFSGCMYAPINQGDSAREEATKFCAKYGMDESFVDDVAELIENAVSEAMENRELADVLMAQEGEEDTQMTTPKPRMFRHFPEIGPLNTYLELGRPADQWITIIKKQVVAAHMQLINGGLTKDERITAAGLNSLDSLLALIADTDYNATAVVASEDLAWLLITMTSWPRTHIDPFLDLLRGLLNVESVAELLAQHLDAPFALLTFLIGMLSDCATDARPGSMKTIRLLLRVLCNLTIRGAVRDAVISRRSDVMDSVVNVTIGSAGQERMESKDFCSLLATLGINIASSMWQTAAMGGSPVSVDLATDLIKTMQKVLYYEKEPEATFSTARALGAIGTVMCCVPACINEAMMNMQLEIVLRLPSVRNKSRTTVYEIAEDLMTLMRSRV